MSLSSGVVMLVILAAASSVAAPPPFQEAAIYNGAGDCKAVADVNRDGLPDIILGGSQLQWFEAPSWTPHAIASANNEFTTDLQAEDVDGDGDPDLVVPDGNSGNNILWFENVDNASSWARHEIGAFGTWGHDVEVADMDQDGRRDVVVRGTVGVRIFYQNNGPSWSLPVALTVAGSEGLGVGDITGDEFPDIVAGGHLYTNPGGRSSLWVESTIKSGIETGFGNPDQYQGVTAVIADFGGSSAKDVAFINQHNSGNFSWFEAPGWTEHVVDASIASHKLNAADMDGDGDLDFVIGQELALTAVLYNNGGGLTWTRQILSQGAGLGTHNARVGDIGGDGDFDVVGANYIGHPPLKIWENMSRVSLDTWTSIRLDDSRGMSKWFGLATGDLTGDGKRDVVSGPYFYRNPGGDMSSVWPRVTIRAGADAMAVMEVDGDKFGDVLMQALPNILWMEAEDAQGSSWVLRRATGGFTPTGHGNGQGYRVADIEPGEKPEFVFTTGAGVWYVRIPSDPLAAWSSVRINSSVSEDGLALGDMDRDGDVDVVAGRTDGTTVSWWENPGNGSGDWTEHVVGTMPSWVDRIETGDLNGDGRLDVIVSNENGQVSGAETRWFASPTNPKGTWNGSQLIASQGSTNSMDVRDMDRDGDLDVVTGEHKGGSLRVRIFENDGAGGGWADHFVDSGKESHLGARTADLDADGDFDILSIAYDDPQNLYLWRNDSGAASPPNRAARPSISPNGGAHQDQVHVTLTCETLGAEIRYTTDGNDPTSGSTLYAGPFTLTANAVVKARAFKTGLSESLVASASFTIVPPLPTGEIRVTDNVMDEGQLSFKVETPSATYYYQKTAGGFSSLIDSQGHDWIGYTPGGGFSGEYRGIPNLGQVCHPGFPTASEGQPMTSTLEVNDNTHARIRSISQDGEWDVTWDFYPGHATLTVNNAGGNYWFLYEGTPGGALGSEDSWTAADGVKKGVSENLSADLPTPEWVYFTDNNLKRSLFLIHHADDDFPEQYWNGNGAMTVWGFARSGSAPSYELPVPSVFSIGLVESDVHAMVSAAINTVLTGGDHTPPTDPTGLTLVSVASTSASFSWTASTDDVGVAGYRIYRNGSQVGTSTANGYTDSGLSAVATYSYTVSAYDRAGNESDQSPAILVTTPEPSSEFLAHWNFDENSGTVAHDLSLNQYNGTVHGALWASGRTGSALHFDGSDDYVHVPSFDISGNAMAIALWIKADDFDVDDARLISKATGTAEQDHYWMISTYGPEKRLRFRLKTGTATSTLIASSGGLSTGQWIHVAAVYDGGTMRLYQNGLEVGSMTKTGIISSAPVAINIGRNPNGYGTFDGLIDDVRIFSSALSRSEILSLIDDGLDYTAFAAWVAGNFSAAEQLDPLISGPSADPSGSGAPNLLRYACGLPARGPVASPTSVSVVSEAGQNYLALTFPRKGYAPDLEYTVQSSMDLTTWTDLPSVLPGYPKMITVRDLVPVSGQLRRFLRLRVSQP